METNDSSQPWLRMAVSGRVRHYVKIEPRRVKLSGTAGMEIKETVEITPQTEDPFHIRKVSTVRGTDIECRLEEIEVSGRKAYVLHVENTRKEPGRFYDSIHLATDSDLVNRITIAVSGYIQPAREKGQ
ncbi:MAG: hypothetical protein KGY38_03910 [Desulfobacterales bacterium]|nr:hypothetical protein [Desulfobacterales bacterium]